MEEYRAMQYTVRCPGCGAVFAVRPDSLTEEQLEKGVIVCPKCGSLMAIKD